MTTQDVARSLPIILYRELDAFIPNLARKFYVS